MQADIGIRRVEPGQAPLLDSWVIQSLAERFGWDIEAGSLHYAFLANLIHSGQLEFAHQARSQLALEPVRPLNETLFGSDAYSADAQRSKASLALQTAVERFLSNPAIRADDKTLSLYRHRLNTMVEALGPTRGIASVTREDCRRLRDDVLLKLPVNRTQRFPDLSVAAAITQADRINAPRLRSATVSLYVDNLKAMFDWAVSEDLRPDNPAKFIRIAVGNDEVERAPFAASHLKSIFSAPIYTGCVDDGRNYAKAGPNRPRGHRFWLPLLALYTGMRLNELCQLRVEDISEHDGIRFFDLRRFSTSGRKLKTKSSARRVPLHVELDALGFLTYVQSLANPGWLFPDIDRKGGEGGSDAISKWFGRFLESRQIKDPSLVFHSFRHTFRDGMRQAGVDAERAHALGGWTESSVGAGYGQGFGLAELSSAMGQLRYPALDLSHLKAATPATVCNG